MKQLELARSKDCVHGVKDSLAAENMRIASSGSCWSFHVTSVCGRSSHTYQNALFNFSGTRLWIFRSKGLLGCMTSAVRSPAEDYQPVWVKR
ncbi:hypothetical protein Pyn_03437 [Prunus yedoensis var. nudiflora]|uniref:Uncharacterized protein n=1 Tax=Prunus yedoensis var. nudiflora TaxID=2094558 RepID=A0A314YYE4_PRUYE|nr:hypothetical protein Pyn_03437 [Prunus yedoensis var. nudiflora]